ncbi:MAG: hypothetical protein BRC32_06045 [Actinobacteria bacterium QS_8_72_14]|nr:MAG: hypothetical protein BRC32_06045 [Actinobacteria bacterium QS_8_72_14]
MTLPGHDTGLRSRVEEVNDDELVIAAPVEAATVAPLPLGGEAELSWSSDRGLHRLSVQLRQRLARSQRWRVGVVAPPERDQRRFGYRVPVMSSLDVRLGGIWHRVSLVDLSDGGLRCLVSPEADVDEHAPCRVRLDLMRDGLEVDGVVVRVREGVDAMLDVGVQFVDVAPAVADELRRYLLDTHLQLRRLDGLSDS